MIQQAIEMIGSDNIENVALNCHKAMRGCYVIVSDNRDYKIINERRVDFNSKYAGMDFYSSLISVNKPIASKLIQSNNYFTFFCRNTEKLTSEDIEKYYEKLEIPEKYKWFCEWIKDNIKRLGKEHKGEIIKVFFSGTREEYRKLGMKYWMEKAISYTKYSNELGAPYGISVSAKKPYSISRVSAPLYTKEECLKVKFFYDILKGLLRRGYNYLYIDDKGIYPANKDIPPTKHRILGGIFFAFTMDSKGQIIIQDMESVINYNRFLIENRKENETGKNRIREIREEKGMSRAELARKSGVPLRTLENWEYQIKQPTDVKQLDKVARVLEVLIEDLI